jgi:hypothetical protein
MTDHLLIDPYIRELEVTPTTDGVHLRCRHCGAEDDWQTIAGTVELRPFVHENDCFFIASIRAAEQAPMN